MIEEYRLSRLVSRDLYVEIQRLPWDPHKDSSGNQAIESDVDGRRSANEVADVVAVVTSPSSSDNGGGKPKQIRLCPGLGLRLDDRSKRMLCDGGIIGLRR
jgi:hypothetical protein